MREKQFHSKVTSEQLWGRGYLCWGSCLQVMSGHSGAPLTAAAWAPTPPSSVPLGLWAGIGRRGLASVTHS